MRDTAPRRWQRWRVAPAARSPQEMRPQARYDRPESPGPDGIRHELVARIRQEIEAGTYDTEEKWLIAEERLLARLCDE